MPAILCRPVFRRADDAVGDVLDCLRGAAEQVVVGLRNQAAPVRDFLK
jgi:hypothetical protein